MEAGSDQLLSALLLADTRDGERVAMLDAREFDSAPAVTRVPDDYLETDRAALEMGRRAADRLTPENLDRFHAFLTGLRRDEPSRYVDDWLEAFARGPDAIRHLLTDTSNLGQAMRSVISFRAFVAKPERDMIMRGAFTNGGRNSIAR